MFPHFILVYCFPPFPFRPFTFWEIRNGDVSQFFPHRLKFASHIPSPSTTQCLHHRNIHCLYHSASPSTTQCLHHTIIHHSTRCGIVFVHRRGSRRESLQ